MIGGQLRREFAVRSLRWWIPIAAVLGMWLTAMIRSSDDLPGEIPLEGWPDGVVAATSLIWTVMAIYFLNAGFDSRSSSRLDVGLPLSARRLWLTHIAAVAGCGLCIPLAVGVSLALGNAMTGRDPLIDPGLLSIGIHACVVMLLALAVMQSPKTDNHTVPTRAGYVTLGVVTGVGSIALLLWLCALPRIWAVLPLVLAVVLGLRVYFLLPRSFVLVSREAERGSRVAGSVADGASRRERARTIGKARWGWLAASAVWRNSFGNGTLLYLMVFCGYGVLLAMMIEFEGWHDQALPMVFWTWLLFCCWILVAHLKLYSFDPMPMDRRRIFAVLIASPLIIVSLVYAGIVAGMALLGVTGAKVDFRDLGSHRCVVVPNDSWEIAWDGRLPVYESPRGAMVSPCGGQAPLPGLSAVVYKPYHTPREASADLVAWQISRAVEAVHGLSIPPDEIRERYLVLDEEGRVAVKEGGLTLHEDFPGLKQARHKGVFPLVLLMIGVPALLFAAAGYRINRGRTSPGVKRYLLAGLFITTMALGMSALAAAAVGLLDLDVLARLVGPLLRGADEETPGGAFSIWALSLLLLLGVYLVARTQFVRMELPAGSAQKK